jgi:hypothetical protein
MLKSATHYYGHYTILVAIWPASANMYQSSFTVHESDQGPGTQPLFLLYEEGRARGMTCETASDAEQDALQRAAAWADARAD